VTLYFLTEKILQGLDIGYTTTQGLLVFAKILCSLFGYLMRFFM